MLMANTRVYVLWTIRVERDVKPKSFIGSTLSQRNLLRNWHFYIVFFNRMSS